MARNLDSGDVPTRCGQWVEDMNSDANPDQNYELENLYMGDAWKQALGLLRHTNQHAKVRPLVASAGIGLQPLQSRHPSYAATFSQGHNDTVAPIDRTGEWWDLLRATPRATSLTDLRSDQTLLVLSEPYARAMHRDLQQLAGSGTEVLLIGGWKDIEGIHRVPADRALRSALGGATSSLLVRMARRWLHEWTGGPLHTTERQRSWDSWASGARVVEIHDRKRMSDSEVLDFARGCRQEDPRVSATAALAKLRAGGSACEQRRFGQLFRESVGVS